ncbi:hypothetical protein P7C73_g1856, partial [Tremellales sp. Uapishka_1]
MQPYSHGETNRGVPRDGVWRLGTNTTPGRVPANTFREPPVDLRRAHRLNASGTRREDETNGNAGVNPSTEVWNNTKIQSAKLKEALDQLRLPPWSKEVEQRRQQARGLYEVLLFNHPLSSHSQSIERLWTDTSYILIASFRHLIANLELLIASQSQSQPPSRNSPQMMELRKSLARFHTALLSEIGYYRMLITRFVKVYRLNDLVQDALAPVGLRVTASMPEDAKVDLMSDEERAKKLGLVYKGLICLGDLERYKEQYSENTRKSIREGKGYKREKFDLALAYYQVAQRLVPDNGSAYNQLAVIASYVEDTFLCIVNYYRSIAVKQPFPEGKANLKRLSFKVYSKWENEQQAGQGAQDGLADDKEICKRDFLVVLSILYLGNDFQHLPYLARSVLPRLQALLRTKALECDAIVRVTTSLIAAHWEARLSASTEPNSSSNQREREVLALDFLLQVFSVLFQVSAEEVESAIQTNDGSAVEMDDMAQSTGVLSAEVRRLLPALRIASKWIKLNKDHITSDLFWNSYYRFVNALSSLFPLDVLPQHNENFEEDLDMRGFLPLKRGLEAKSVVRSEEGSAHPNVEQLMRISDLIIDSRLISPNQSTPRNPASLNLYDEHDVASVSTDDPIEEAMEARQSDLGSLDGQDSDQEEQIIFKGSSTKPTAQDLLQDLMIVSPDTPPATKAHVPAQTTPSLLFGVEGGIWSPGTGNPAFKQSRDLSAIWNAPPPAQPQSYHPSSQVQAQSYHQPHQQHHDPNQNYGYSPGPQANQPYAQWLGHPGQVPAPTNNTWGAR